MLSIFLGCDRLCLLQPVHPDTGRGSRLQTLHLWGPGPRRHCSRHYSDCHVTCAGRWILNMMWIWICNLSAHYSLRNIRLQETQNIFAPGFMVQRCQVYLLRWDAQQPADSRRGPDRVVHFCKYPDWAERRRGGEEGGPASWLVFVCAGLKIDCVLCWQDLFPPLDFITEFPPRETSAASALSW